MPDAAADLLDGQGLEIGVVELHLAVSQLLEPGESRVEGVSMNVVAELLEGIAERRPARVLTQHQLALALADGRRVHDLVGGALVQHTVLVDTGLVGEGVTAHDCLVVLHRIAGEAADDPAGLRQLLGPYAHLNTHVGIGPCLDGHDDLLHGSVAGPLADAVDGALHLTGAGLYGGQGVGHGEAQVVVAVRRDHVVAGDPLPDRTEALSPLDRSGETHGVRDVERAGTVVDGGLEHIAHEVEIRAGSILGAELDIIGVLACTRHRRGGLGQHLGGAHLELELHVRRAGGDERVDASAGSRLDGFPAAVDVLVGGARQPADGRTLYRRGDRVDRLEVSLAGDREAGLDVVDAQACQLLGDLQLLPDVQGDTR